MKRFIVLPGVDPDLDKSVVFYKNSILVDFLSFLFLVFGSLNKSVNFPVKHTYANLPKVMMELSPLELQDLPDHIEECSVSFLPEIGFLLCVPMWKENLTEKEMDISGYKFKV